MNEILAAIESLSDDERAVLVRHLMFDIEPIEPVNLTWDEEGARLVLPDGREVGELFELDHATRYNYPMGDTRNSKELDIYQDVANFETVVWAVKIDGKMVPVTLPDDFQINYI